ncbi:unnamed protein product [Callosobruchus maculatus]|uniref:tRNA-queuosine alpha-mannosyltransferase n=1 Tax=Callosobruchus maculatus TaxID=64391 RepID=A0A653BII6_CALMS|nr:unnamed protein product [Callosobruchus maculatus]
MNFVACVDICCSNYYKVFVNNYRNLVLVRADLEENGIKHKLVALPAKKWHWRARCSALQLYSRIEPVGSNEILWCSSVLNLAELLGLRPDLNRCRKITYFHENQLIYPVQQIKERDIQYALNEINSCLASDLVLFNSVFNRTSFLDNISKIIKIIPDNRPKDVRSIIEIKSRVMYFPVKFPKMISGNSSKASTLQIVWPHRWEFDKDPDEFFEVMMELKKSGMDFQIVVLGEQFTDVPEVFEKMNSNNDLKDRIVHFGFVESKDEYYRILSNSHVAVSTAKHEFFGISMLEATYCGCLPLVPNNLVYPEIYPESAFTNRTELISKLKHIVNAHRKHWTIDSSYVLILKNILQINWHQCTWKY